MDKSQDKSQDTLVRSRGSTRSTSSQHVLICSHLAAGLLRSRRERCELLGVTYSFKGGQKSCSVEMAYILASLAGW